MHATADTLAVINHRITGRRVMRSVRRLVAEHEAERLGAESHEVSKRLRVASGAGFGFLVAGAGRGSCQLRAPRYHKGASPPNKRMHPTADTDDVV